MSKRTRKFLNSPASEVICRLLDDLSAKVGKRLDALRKGDDPDALHDARVEIKRLRVWLKHGKSEVKTRSKARHALRDFTKASNPMRDREVMLQWLAELKPEGNRIKGVTDVRFIAQREMDLLEARVMKLTRSLRVVLNAHRRRSAEGHSFGYWLAEQVAGHQLTLVQDLENLPEGLHEARLTGKHLRYLIEPISGDEVSDRALVLLKELQELLGQAHDMMAMRSSFPEVFAQTLADTGFDSIRHQIETGQSLTWRTPACWPGMRFIVDQLNADQARLEQEAEQWRDRNLAELIEVLGALRARLVREHVL
ncbi:MAG: CHAD domain-containing protein [Halothiobacillaceae bacterium]